MKGTTGNWVPDDFKPVILGAVSQRLTADDAVALKGGLGVMTGSIDSKKKWEQCAPGDPCYTKDPI